MIVWGLLVAGFVTGYWLGRRDGVYLGVQRGTAFAPLVLREQAQREGTCPICSKVLHPTEGENCQMSSTVVEWTKS